MKHKNKKAITPMIGYILLVTMAVVMGSIAYQWIRSYVPEELSQCPEDVTVFVKDYSCATGQFNLTIQNKGKFGVAGYFIHISNETDKEIATIDISSKVTQGGIHAGNAIIFLSGDDNPLMPDDDRTVVFDLTGEEIGDIYIVELLPARYQKQDGRLKLVSCGSSRIKEKIATCVVGA